jgi:spore maturation protein SpmB
LQELLGLIFAAGRTALDLALYLMLPVMVIMLALMKVLEARGVLAWMARLLSPPLRIFGVPGAGAFAMLQLLLVSFAGPIATLSLQDRDGTARRRIAATLAMVLCMSQANVIFPMAAVGLNLGVVVLTSLVGGLCAAALTFYVFTRPLGSEGEGETAGIHADGRPRASTWGLMVGGGQEAVQIVLNAIPALLIALFLVNILKSAGVIATVEQLVGPLLELAGLPAAAVLPLLTKYLAGGTAMMGVTLELLKQGTMTIGEFNRLAGFIINPLDMVGVAVLIASGPRVASVARPAVLGAIAGVLVRGFLHLIIFSS